MTTRKTIALTMWTFVGKVISLLFNTLSRFVIDFLPRRKCLLISWLQSPSAVILKPKKTKPAIVSTFSPFVCHENMGLSWVTLLGMAHSFIELCKPLRHNKAVICEGDGMLQFIVLQRAGHNW